MSSTGSGLQRMVELFWNKNLANTDHKNPIVVLGQSYSPVTPPSPSSLEDPSTTARQDDPSATPTEQSVSDLRQLFQSFSFVKSTESKKPSGDEWPAEFLADVYTRIWLTYRTKFPPIERDQDGPSPLSLQNLIRGQNYDLHGDYFTTDCGWGCMIRTAQTMLANTLLNLHAGREWRFQNGSSEEHDKIVKWFIDTPEHPFSIHRIVDKGRALSGKKAGEWFGPSAAARSIQALCAEFDAGLNAYIGSDSGDIYEQDFFKVAKGEDGTFRPTLILLGVRLGIDNVNSIYWQSLKDILSSSQTAGISGGRPSSSHFFFGYQGDYLFYLDPHIPQAALKDDEPPLDKSVSESTEIVPTFNVETVHTDKIRKIHLSEIDPSMLLGFLIKDEQEWNEWKALIQNPENKNKIVHISPDHSPIGSLTNRKPSFVVYNEDGNDFVDVGLEYDDIPETENGEEEQLLSAEAKDHEVQPEEGDSVVMISQSGREIEENKTNLESVPKSMETAGSFEDYTGSIKDDYENIGTALSNSARFDDSTTVVVDTVKNEEEPYMVEKSEVASESINEPVFSCDWDQDDSSKDELKNQDQELQQDEPEQSGIRKESE